MLLTPDNQYLCAVATVESYVGPSASEASEKSLNENYGNRIFCIHGIIKDNSHRAVGFRYGESCRYLDSIYEDSRFGLTYRKVARSWSAENECQARR